MDGEEECNWKPKLNRNLVFLFNTMQSDVDLLTHLMEANVLTLTQKEKIQIIEARYDRNDALITFLLTRPEKDYHQFLRALVKTGQKHIVERIEGQSGLKRILNQGHGDSGSFEKDSREEPHTVTESDSSGHSNQQSNRYFNFIGFNVDLGSDSDHDSITVTGGLNSNGFTRDVFRIQQEQSNKCIPLPDLQLKTPRGHHQSVAIREYVITIGGKDETQSLSSAECKNVKLKRSEIIPSMITPRRHFTCAVIGDKIFVAGGWNDRSGELNLCEYYTVSGNTWTNCSPMNCIRCRSSGDVLNGNLYITGGSTYSDSIDKRSVESYNPMVDNWVPQPSLRKGRYDHCCATLDRAIYATGGRGGMQECEFYDPRVDEWRECAGMKQGRRGHALVAFNGKLYAIGGIDAKGAILGSLETYDPAKNEWEITEDVFEPLFAMSAFIS